MACVTVIALDREGVFFSYAVFFFWDQFIIDIIIVCGVMLRRVFNPIPQPVACSSVAPTHDPADGAIQVGGIGFPYPSLIFFWIPGNDASHPAEYLAILMERAVPAMPLLPP